ncbi:MAG: hypothetical protein ACYS6K_05300 [Planctomycetota bacterium]
MYRKYSIIGDRKAKEISNIEQGMLNIEGQPNIEQGMLNIEGQHRVDCKAVIGVPGYQEVVIRISGYQDNPF